MQIEIPGWCGS